MGIKKLFTVLILGLVFSSLTVMAFAGDAGQFGVGKTKEVQFFQSVKVGDVVLPAGVYKVRHLMEGSNHVMLFRGEAKGAKEARVNCKMVSLPNKADQTTTEFRNTSGERVLTAVTFQGDNYRHEF